MGLFKGGALRLFTTLLYALTFCCAGIILGIYSYFLSVLADRNQGIANWKRAVEGISGAAVLYLIFAVLLTCCLGGISFLAFMAIVLDICFVGGMIAIAVMTRHGASSCRGFVRTPLGNGQANSSTGGFGNGGFGEGGNNSNSNVTYSVSLKTACRYNTVVFAVSLIAAFLFLVTALMQIALVRQHKKEKRYGPSPSNNYTSGPGKRRGMFGKKNKTDKHTKDAELGAVGAGAGAGTLAAGHHHDMRPSHETGYTGSTVAAPGTASFDKADGVNNTHLGNNNTHLGTNNAHLGTNNAHQGHLPHGTHGGYYTQPQGTGVNPYGYENTGHVAPGTATNY